MAVTATTTNLKMVWRWLCLALLAAAAAAAAAGDAAKEDVKERFDHFRVYRVVPMTLEQLQVLREFRKLGDGVSFWTPPALNKSVDVMVSEALRDDVLRGASAAGMDAALYIDNVQKLIDEENPLVPRDGLDWNAYHRPKVINDWLRLLPEQYPDKVTISTILKRDSPQEDILCVKISNGDTMNTAVFVESGMNGNEWITIAVTTHMLDTLLNDENDGTLTDIFDWYIVPMANPDGYEYSHVYNRLWKKNRPNVPETSPQCRGVNLNRNFDEDEDNMGSSSEPCDDNYRGEEAFSEDETNALKNFLQEVKDLLVYFSLHSYGQALTVPYGVPKFLEDYYFHENIMKGAVKYVTNYSYGQTYKVVSEYSVGSSLDWVKDTLKTKYAYQWLLPDKGRRGFLLPANEIVPTAKETIKSMKYILEQVKFYEELPREPPSTSTVTDPSTTDPSTTDPSTTETTIDDTV